MRVRPPHALKRTIGYHALIGQVRSRGKIAGTAGPTQYRDVVFGASGAAKNEVLVIEALHVRAVGIFVAVVVNRGLVDRQRLAHLGG